LNMLKNNVFHCPITKKAARNERLLLCNILLLVYFTAFEALPRPSVKSTAGTWLYVRKVAIATN